MNSVPAYKKVYTALKNRIKDGSYPVGSLLPTEKEIGEEFYVSRTTVRRAAGLLAEDGYVKIKQGSGTVVLDPSTTQKLNSITSISETLKEKGFKITTRSMHISREAAPKNVALRLGIEEGASVYKVQRVQCADGAPIAIMTNFLNADKVPGLDRHANEFASLYEFLERHYHIRFTDAEEYLTAITATFEEAEILNVPVGSPLLRSKRITYTESGTLEYAVTKIVADKYEYCVYLQGRNSL
jgi:GntR family transcriptional regulator